MRRCQYVAGVDPVARERVESEVCLSLHARGVRYYIAKSSHCPPMRCVCH